MTKHEEELKNYRTKLVDKILALPASACNLIFAEFTVRGEGHPGITWDAAMLEDEGVPMNTLVDIYTLTSNRIELIP